MLLLGVPGMLKKRHRCCAQASSTGNRQVHQDLEQHKEALEMWIVEYRELIRILTISDLKVKYQSSVLGFAWSMLNPLLLMLVLYFVFTNVFKNNQDHFALYLLIGIISWRFMANGTSSSMIGHRRQIQPGDEDLHPPSGAGAEHSSLQLHKLTAGVPGAGTSANHTWGGAFSLHPALSSSSI